MPIVTTKLGSGGAGRTAPDGPMHTDRTPDPSPAPGYALGEQRAIALVNSAVETGTAAPANALDRLADSYVQAAATCAALGLDAGSPYSAVVAAIRG